MRPLLRVCLISFAALAAFTISLSTAALAALCAAYALAGNTIIAAVLYRILFGNLPIILMLLGAGGFATALCARVLLGDDPISEDETTTPDDREAAALDAGSRP